MLAKTKFHWLSLHKQQLAPGWLIESLPIVVEVDVRILLHRLYINFLPSFLLSFSFETNEIGSSGGIDVYTKYNTYVL